MAIFNSVRLYNASPLTSALSDLAASGEREDAATHILKASILDFQGFKTSTLDSLDAALSPLAVKSLSAEERGDGLYKRAELKMAMSRCGRVDSALNDLTESVTLSPNNAKAFSLLGECYEVKKLKDGAIESHEEALRLNPQLAVSREALDRCLLGDKEVACRENESGIRGLKRKSFNLNSLLRKLEMQKAELIPQEILSSDTDTSEPECSDTDDMSDDDWVNSVAVRKNNRGRSNRVPSTGGNRSLTSADGFGVGFCCVCSKVSFCKTIKCQCRAIGGSCGSSRRCLLSKCTNRCGESEQDVQSKMQDEENGNGSEIDETYRNLASHGAMLLQCALADKPVEARRKASDIGNTLTKSNIPKPNKRKNWRKSTIQLVTDDSPPMQPNNSEAIQSQKPENSTSEVNIALKLPRAMRSASSSGGELLRERNVSQPDESVGIKDGGALLSSSSVRQNKVSDEKENCGL